ncbi:helix-turn-helix domain-containing protein [Sphingomonas oleivorans]|uniref:helix-turn-helix domain-containing protein n=1 Tax=Sphingomonas oleivorans TaxID=1735121 RepID=UPI003C6F2008
MAPGRPSPDNPFGDLLRQWRVSRRLSQMDLALEAGVSTRHLSCVETGKARPSRELVAVLAGALEIPMRDCNALLVAAGFAPGYRETALSDPQMALVRRGHQVHAGSAGALSCLRREPALGRDDGQCGPGARLRLAARRG